MGERYDRIRNDWLDLWSLGPADDISGGYVDQDDLAIMLKTPTKSAAADCMERQIAYWLQVGMEREDMKKHGYTSVDDIIMKNPTVADIARRYP